MSDEYRVSLETFGGPLDLLLFLVRKEEVDIHDVPVASILQQYLDYMKMIDVLDLDSAGDFLVMASTLMLIKSRMLLPTEDVDLEEEIDPREELVRQLLEYKEIKDSSELLEHQRERFSQMLGRPDNCRPVKIAPEDRELEETSLWDLLLAFNKVIESIGPDMGSRTRRIIVDDRPVSAFAQIMRETLERERSVRFSELLGGAQSRQEIIGLFLALLLLLKRELVICAQDGSEDIRIIFCGDTAGETLGEEEMNEFK